MLALTSCIRVVVWGGGWVGWAASCWGELARVDSVVGVMDIRSMVIGGDTGRN